MLESVLFFLFRVEPVTECALVPIRTCRNRCLGGGGGEGQSEEEDIEEQLRTGGIGKDLSTRESSNIFL